MKYMGKIRLKRKYPISVIADELGLKEMSTFDTKDMVGTM